MVGKHGITIWFFIGSLLVIYGIAIFTANLYEFFNPAAGRDIVLKELHFGVWWGLLLLAIGIIYVVKFNPRKRAKNA